MSIHCFDVINATLSEQRLCVTLLKNKFLSEQKGQSFKLRYLSGNFMSARIDHRPIIKTILGYNFDGRHLADHGLYTTFKTGPSLRSCIQTRPEQNTTFLYTLVLQNNYIMQNKRIWRQHFVNQCITYNK